MRLSVIVPAFNEEKCLQQYLPRSIESLKQHQQQIGAWEIIVCDNNSTDNTAAIAESLGAKVIHEPINQIARARNTGASIASGEWLLFVDADSCLSPELVENFATYLPNKSYAVLGSTIRVIDGKWWYRWSFAWAINTIIRLFNLAAGTCILVRKDLFEKVGGFPTTLFVFEELEFTKQVKREARRQGLKFKLITNTPCLTSGRKGDLYGFWSIVRTGFYLMLSPFKSPTQRKGLTIWYDGKR